MQITSTPKYSSTTQFKARRYQEIKLLPKLHCACCDRPMINTRDIAKAFAAISRPFAQMLKKEDFSYWENQPEIWAILTNFAKSFPEQSLDLILRDKERRTKLKMALVAKARNSLTFDESFSEKDKEYVTDKHVLNDYGDILNRSRNILKGSNTVMKRFASFKKYLTGEKLATFEQLEIYAQRYPRKTLKEIINLEDIYKFHKAKDLLQRADSREKLNYHLKNIEKMIKKVDPNSEDLIYDLKEKTLELFHTARDDSGRIYFAKQIYKEALSRYNNKNLEKKVFAELEQIPTTFITKDSFLAFAKNHNYGDARIISSILIPAEASFEHIVPRIHNGDNDPNNGLVLCRECNAKRASIPYEEFIQYHPRMPYNVQKQINQISNYILEGRLDGAYQYWPIKVAETLKEYTNGAIYPDVSGYVRKALKKTNDTIKSNNADLNTIKQEQNNKAKEKENLLKELHRINQSIHELKEEKNHIQEDNKKEEILSKTLNEYLRKK